MTINESIIEELEGTYRKRLPSSLKRYNMDKNPFRMNSVNRIFTQISTMIFRLIEAGKLDVTIKTPIR